MIRVLCSVKAVEQNFNKIIVGNYYIWGIEMFCHKCGNKIVDDSSFCPKCGTKLEILPSASISTVPSTSMINKSFVLYLSFTVSAISIILFFFPWFKVLGQNIFTYLGYGSQEGFNILNFYLMIIDFMDYAQLTFGDKATIVIFALALGAGAPIIGLWSNFLNCFRILTTHELKTETTTGGVWFIVGYYILKYLAESYVSSATSYDWLGELAGVLFNNLITITNIPWVLAALSIINAFLLFVWKRSKPKEVIAS